jgi:hypothetical protein
MSAKKKATGGREPRRYEIRVRGPIGPTMMQAFRSDSSCSRSAARRRRSPNDWPNHMIDARTTHTDSREALSMTVESKQPEVSVHTSKATQPLTGTPPSTTYVQSLLIRLHGITAGDYLTWVRDPEPPALDQGLRSIGIRAEPLEALVNIKLVWALPPPTTPRAAAVAAGFPLTPEVVAVRSAACNADRDGPPSSRARMPARSHRPSPLTEPHTRF